LVRVRFDQFRIDQQEVQRTRTIEHEPERQQRRPSRERRPRPKR
jgi:hypothetical protein